MKSIALIAALSLTVFAACSGGSGTDENDNLNPRGVDAGPGDPEPNDPDPNDPDQGDPIPDNPTPSTVSCSDFCDHAATCVPDGDRAICMQSCAGMGATCRSCIVGNSCSAIESGLCNSLCVPPEGDPSGGQDCTPLTYSSGSLGDGTNQGANGSECFFPADCLSRRCVHAQIDDFTSQDFCGSKGDCRSPNNIDEECPSTWQCVQISQDELEDEGLQYICIPPDINACPTPGELF